MQPDKQEQKNWLKRYGKIMLVVALILVVFYWASGDALFHTDTEMPSTTASDCAAVMTQDTSVNFDFVTNSAYVDSVSFLLGTYGRENGGKLTVSMYDDQSTLLAEKEIMLNELKDYVYQKFVWDEPVAVQKGQVLTLRLTTTDVPDGQGISVWYGTTISAGRFELDDPREKGFRVNDVQDDRGIICYTVQGRDNLWLGSYYWYIAGGVIALMALYGAWLQLQLRKGYECLLVRLYAVIRDYKFLIKQLVARDFKRKYIKSVLGVLWSFLNPLLTMLVQYLVFSTIFKSTIENFIVYLLVAIVEFNFFGEATSLGMMSILDNANLINKVYMPKVIYPVSRVLSAGINLAISLIPLLLVAIVTGIPLTRAIILIPVGLILLMIFSLGMALLLSTSMVFFRDTQFLWGVFFTLWNYLTPTFYPLSIIPEAWQTYFKMNPLYSYVTFIRSLLLDGAAPDPSVYAGCVISAAVVLILGIIVFRCNQNKFILHI